MSHGVAVSTRLAGDPQGEFKDDLTAVQQWLRPGGFKRITNIQVYASSVIDSVRITYEGSSEPVIHGGLGGDPKLTFPVKANQTITAVYGRHLNDYSIFGKNNIVQLSFVVVTTQSDGKPPTVEAKPLEGATGTLVSKANTQFQFTWPLAGAFSYSYKPSSSQVNQYLQGIGFTELFAQAGPAL